MVSHREMSIVLFTAVLQFDKFRLGEVRSAKQGRCMNQSLCLLYLFLSINPFSLLTGLFIFTISLVILSVFALFFVCESVCARVAHLQPLGPSEWKPARHVSHFSPVTPTRHAHLPSTSHCRLTEPGRDSRRISRKKEKKGEWKEDTGEEDKRETGSIFKKMKEKNLQNP